MSEMKLITGKQAVDIAYSGGVLEIARVQLAADQKAHRERLAQEADWLEKLSDFGGLSIEASQFIFDHIASLRTEAEGG